MSFGAGMGAGMGAGIGAGMAIGVSSGKKRACEEIREQFHAKELTIHDQAGNEVDIDELLVPISNRECSSKKGQSIALMVLLLIGVLALGVLTFFALRYA